MNNKTIVILLIIVLVGAGVIGFLNRGGTANEPEATTTPTTIINNTISDGTLEFGYPEEFGLAVTKEQVLVSAYIPPCNEGFNYCLYYKDNSFTSTNFESAGIRFQKMTSLATESACLNTSPEGYSGMVPSTNTPKTSSNYAASIFSPIGDAGAGHYASGEIYRIYIPNSPVSSSTPKCYEVETRIGETQFANYPVGTKVEFSEGDRNSVYKGFNTVLGSLTLMQTGEKIVLPESEN